MKNSAVYSTVNAGVNMTDPTALALFAFALCVIAIKR